MKNIPVIVCAYIALYIFAGTVVGQPKNVSTVNIQFDGSKRFQQIDGIGVNVNTRSWNGKELEPAIDTLLNSMHAVIWRVIVETVEKWEDVNDNNDPLTFNWDYYNQLYETPKFQRAWGLIQYLNKHHITDGLMINFMGPVPQWMGGEFVKPEFEDEYIEMLVSFFYYARNTRHLQFGLIAPTNESDWRKEGPELSEHQHARILRKLIDRLQSLGLGDIRFVAPDPADMRNGIKRYIPALMKDPVIMSKLAHIGLHSYGGYYANADSALKNSAYPKSTLWITEWNAWRNGLDDGKLGVYDYTFASECVNHLLDLLNHGATAAIVWEGYDSYYEHHAPSPFSYWGILGYNPATKTYFPRKHLYAIEQVSKFVQPGSFRISVSESGDSLRVSAFHDPASQRTTIIGVNNRSTVVSMEGKIVNLPQVLRFEMVHTNGAENLHNDPDVTVAANSFNTTIPPHCIFTLIGNDQQRKVGSATSMRPEPPDWFAGDIHVHRNCGDAIVLPESKLPAMMKENDLAVISVLADMGNGEVKNSKEDLKKVTGKDALESGAGRIIHWDTEWHWDATYSQFGHQALGGHLVLLGLKNAQPIWDESPYKILEWSGKQQGIGGFAHMQYLNDSIQNELNCCIPIEYPVEAALGTIDFVSEDVFGSGLASGNYNSTAVIDAYYKLLNCGLRLGLAAGTDYPCNNGEPLGTLLTYVNVKRLPLTYQNWIEGIKKGRTVVARNGHNEFLEMKAAKGFTPGDELKFQKGGTVVIEVKWTAVMEMAGRIELISNGRVIATQNGIAKPGVPLTLTTSHQFTKSSWVAARRMDENGHQSHTAPIYITIDNKPVRASAEDAHYFVRWIDNLLEKTSPGGAWNRFFTHDINIVQDRYRKARDIYRRIGTESQPDR